MNTIDNSGLLIISPEIQQTTSTPILPNRYQQPLTSLLSPSFNSFNDSNYFSKTSSCLLVDTPRTTSSTRSSLFTIDSILSGTNKENTNVSCLQINSEQPMKITKTNRSKRMRTIFTQEQLDRLELEFQKQQYMVGSERYYLANELNLNEIQVKIWFQNRRIKWRKENLDSNRNRHNADEDDDEISIDMNE